MKGQAVCRKHGGSAPQAIRAAQQRLANAAEDMAQVLIYIAMDPAASPADRRQAATAVLDRVGISAKAELDVTLRQREPWQAALEAAVVVVSDDDQSEAGEDGAGGNHNHDAAYAARRAAYATHPGPPGGDVVVGELVDDGAD